MKQKKSKNTRKNTNIILLIFFFVFVEKNLGLNEKQGKNPKKRQIRHMKTQI